MFGSLFSCPIPQIERMFPNDSKSCAKLKKGEKLSLTGTTYLSRGLPFAGLQEQVRSKMNNGSSQVSLRNDWKPHK